MGMKPNTVDDLDLFEAYTNKSIDEYEPEDIEIIINKALSEYETILKVKDSDEFKVTVQESLTNKTFSFWLNDEKIPYAIQPILNLMFGDSSEVEETAPNTFIVSQHKFSSLDELKQWIVDNTPFKNVEVVEADDTDDTNSQYVSTTTINVGGVDVTLNRLTDDEMQQRRWQRFADKYDEDHRILVTVRNSPFHAKVSMKLVFAFGSYDEGNWDIFNTEGNRLIQNMIDEREENNDPTPVTYIVGVKNEIDTEKVKQFQKSVNRLKITT